MAYYTRNEFFPSCIYCGNTNLYAKGMCKNCYARALRHNGDPSYCCREPKQMFIEKQQMSWQKRLAIDVLGDIPKDNIDLEKSVDYVVATLNEKLKKVIELRYKENLTLKEVGEKFNLTQERIRQLQNKALRKLRYQDRADVILFGEKIASQKAKERIANIESLRFKQKCADLPSNKYIVTANMTMRELLENSYPSIISTRSYNCLSRNLYCEGLDIDEILISEFVEFVSKKNMSLEEYIMKIRNCGAMSAKELINMMNSVLSIKEGII